MSIFKPQASAGPSSANNTGIIVSTGGYARPFTPPLFGSFGKKAKDLFKKKYDYENSATLVNRTGDNIEVETKIVAANNAPLRGTFKSVVPVTTAGALNGVFESEFQTVANKESKTSYKLTNLARGVTVKLGLTGVKPDVKGETPDFPEGWASAEVEYGQEYFAGSLGVRTNSQKTLADVVVSLGYDDLTVGAKAVIDTASKAAPSDYNFGAEYKGKGYVASAVTEKKRTALTLSYHQCVGRRQVVGASATFGLVKPTRSLTFGTDYAVDADTEIRSFIKIDSGKDDATVGVAVTHRLLNPAVLVGVASEFNISPSNVQAGKMGVSLTFGDY